MVVHLSPINQGLAVVCALSMFASAVSMVITLMKPKKRLATLGARIVFNLNLADFLWNFGWLVNLTTQTCPAFATINLLGTLASCSCKYAIGLYLLMMFSMKGVGRENEWWVQAIFQLICWLPPVVFMIVPVAMHKIAFRAYTGCWVSADIIAWVVLVPRSVFMVVNLFTIIAVIILMRRASSGTPTKGKNRTIRLLAMQFVFLIYSVAIGVSYIGDFSFTSFCNVLAATQGLFDALLTQMRRIEGLFIRLKTYVSGSDSSTTAPSSVPSANNSATVSKNLNNSDSLDSGSVDVVPESV